VEAVELEDHPQLTLRPDAMRRCLFNLAANAARYGETVAITGRREARAFLVSIDDDGPGIPPDQREEVFKPFVRLDDARQDAGGSGLGLSIARDIARAHGGEVSLHDSPLGGLRATVRIPA
jgi:two-component system osmolarity sensor histidine kinase EnvZ